jgi:hypothetical protein
LNLQEHCDSLQGLTGRTSAEITIEVLTAVTMEITVRQRMKLCNPLKCVKVFVGICRYRFQRQRLTNLRQQYTASIFRFLVEAIGSLEN